MSFDDRQIISAALALPPERRVAIAERIFDSLSKDELYEEAAVKEAESRLDAYYRGEIETVPAEEVLGEFLE